jgi:hypothetical protein
VPSGCVLSMTVPIAVVGLVVASVIGNRINGALPRGFGLVGMAVTVCVVALVLALLIAPRRSWREARQGFPRSRRWPHGRESR